MGWPEEIPFRAESFQRYDESPDSLFYQDPRFVTHIDDKAIGALRGYYEDERGGAAAQRGPDRVRSAGLEPEAAAAVRGQRLRLCGERGVGGLPDAPVRNVRRDPARAQARGPRRDVLLEPVLPHEGHLRLDVHRRPGPHHDRGLLLPLHTP